MADRTGLVKHKEERKAELKNGISDLSEVPFFVPSSATSIISASNLFYISFTKVYLTFLLNGSILFGTVLQ